MHQANTSFNANAKGGLTTVEVDALRAVHGPNVITGRQSTPWWQLLARQFASVLIFVLIAAAGIAFLMGELVDALAITAILLMNGCLGFVQEWKAERTLESLRAMLSSQALVIRDGIETSVDVSMLVPGDRVILHSGVRVPADIVLLQSADLGVDESALTGESLSVSKEAAAEGSAPARENLAYMGTTVVNGRAEGIVNQIGMLTEFGKIAGMISPTGNRPTHLQDKLAKLGRQLGMFAILLVLAVIVLGWFGGKGFTETILTGLSLAVAVIPEGLPAVVTVTLALGARAMVRRNALTRSLQATETLGSASVICTDKTGTLTENEMTVVEIWTPGEHVTVAGTGYEPKGQFERDGQPVAVSPRIQNLLQSALICNHADTRQIDNQWKRIGEPTEAALVVAAMKAGLSREALPKIASEIPFSSDRKRMSVLTTTGASGTVHMKGAPEAVLSACRSTTSGGSETESLSAHATSDIHQAYRALAERGLRVLAVASKETVDAGVDPQSFEHDLTFLGLVGIIDPPRPEVKQAIDEARNAGISVVMITGDAPVTALAIARMLDLRATEAVTGPMLDDMEDDALADSLAKGTVFARTTPCHKMRIVAHLQAAGKVVAMTGDGVNDAPALKRADIGIAMGIRGTDVARDASDLVLLDDNFASIVAAIAEGRRQYENIKKFVRYLLSSNAGEIIAIMACMMIGGPLIFVPIQILWMNLVTDGPTALTLSLEKSEVDAMNRPPRSAQDDVVGIQGLAVILGFAAYTGSATLFAFYSVLDHGVLQAQTVAFTTMICLEKFSVFAFRSLRLPLFKLGLFSNPWLLVAVIGTLLAQVAAIYWPPLQAILHTEQIDPETWFMIGALVIPVLIVPEIIKAIWLYNDGPRDTHSPKVCA